MVQTGEDGGGLAPGRGDEGRRRGKGKGGGRVREQPAPPLTVKTKGRAPLRVASKNTAPPDTPSSSNSQSATPCVGDWPAAEGERQGGNGACHINGHGAQQNGHGLANGSVRISDFHSPGMSAGRFGSTGIIPSLGPNHSAKGKKYDIGSLASPRNGANLSALSRSGSGSLGQRTGIRSTGQADGARQANTRPVAMVHQAPQTVPVQDGTCKDHGTPRGPRGMGATDSGRRQSAARPGQTAQQENGKVTVGERSHGGRQFGATSPLLAKATPARKAAPGPGPQGQAGASLRPMQAGRELHRSNTTQRVPSVPSPTSHVQLRASEASNAGGDRRKEPLQHRSAPVSGSRRVKQVPGQPLGPKVISEPSDRDCHCSSAPELNGLRVEADRDEGNNFPTSTHELPEFDQNGSHLQDHQEGAAMHASNSELLSPLSGPQANRHSSLSPTGTTGSDPSLPGEEPGKKSGKRRNRRRSSKKSRPIPSGVPGADFVDAPALPPTAFSQGLRPDRGASSPAPGVHVHHQPDVGPRRVAPCDAQQHDVESHDMSYVSAWPTGSAPAELWGVGDDMTASTLANANMAGFVSAASPRTSQQPQAACVPIVTEKESGDDQEMLSRQPQSPQVKDALKALCSDTFPGNGIRFYECGITNLGNTCFVGSALQLLLASRRFCWLLKQLSIVSHCLNPHMLPTLVGLGELAKGLTERGGQRKPQAAAQQGCHGWASGRTAKPVMPIMLSTVVNRFQQRHAQSTLGGLAEEHDAQEFLLYLLEQMEVELLKLKEAVLVGQGSPSPREIQQDDDDWEVAGRKGKSATKRTAGSQAESMLSAIFGGSVQSEVKASKMKPSIVVHRFTALDLDIAPKKVNTIEDALQLYTEPDHLTDYRPTDTSKPQTATKANRLRDLPQVLLVSLKRYAYTEDGLQKIHKRIGFGSMLTIQRQWLAESKPIRADYRLVATCSHHGRGHGGDHYTANVLQPVGMWLNFNDSVINQMLWRDVENDAPYMLLYERASK